MPVSSKSDGGVHNGGGESFANVGFATGLILPYLEILCGPAYFITRADNLLRVRIFHYACGYFITRADILPRVRIFYHACGYFTRRADILPRVRILIRFDAM